MTFRTAYGNIESEDGWRMCNDDECDRGSVPGTDVWIPLRSGIPNTILKAFASRFHELIEPLDQSQCGGWTLTNDVGSSNHLAGTAMDLNWRRHPFRVRGTFGDKLAALRALLAEFRGCVWWGGDWHDPIDEMHFQLNYGEGSVGGGNGNFTVDVDQRLTDLANDLKNGYLGVWAPADPNDFPLPGGYFWGPLTGPVNCISGEAGEPQSWLDGLGRWQAALGITVTHKWNDGATPKAATTLQLAKGWQPTPGIGYGCVYKGEWDAVIKEGWRLPPGWKASDVQTPMLIDANLMWEVAPTYIGHNHDDQAAIIGAVGPALRSTLDEYDINTALRVAHFMAQVCEESAGFRTTVEFASGAEYEGRGDLGNTQPGDGPRYKGRGLLQLTGRANYRQYGTALGVDLEGNPEMAADPPLSLRIACEYWRRRNINPDCDRDDLEAVTRKVNGGLHGLDDRRLYLGKAKIALAQAVFAEPKVVAAEPKAVPTGNVVPSNDSVVLKVGDSGDKVRQLQVLLNHDYPAYSHLIVDGEFGPHTEQVVREFQSRAGLLVTGVVDSSTLQKLGASFALAG
jgi:putative chitinase